MSEDGFYNLFSFKDSILTLKGKENKNNNKTNLSCNFSKSMHWTPNHDKIFIKVLLKVKEKNHREREYLEIIAESLCQMTEQSIRVDDRAVRDMYKVLEKKYIRKRNQEERASGIEPPEETEVEKGIPCLLYTSPSPRDS